MSGVDVVAHRPSFSGRKFNRQEYQDVIFSVVVSTSSFDNILRAPRKLLFS